MARWQQRSEHTLPQPFKFERMSRNRPRRLHSTWWDAAPHGGTPAVRQSTSSVCDTVHCTVCDQLTTRGVRETGEREWVAGSRAGIELWAQSDDSSNLGRGYGRRERKVREGGAAGNCAKVGGRERKRSASGVYRRGASMSCLCRAAVNASC